MLSSRLLPWCLRLVLLSLAAGAHARDLKPAVTPEVPDDVSARTEILQPGVTLTLLAEHPDLVTPTGIDVAEDGSIWLVASHTHFRPESYEGPEHDEILVFDADGGSRRVFYAKTDATMDLELDPGGWVYLAERDRILRVRDSDGDGVGDVEEDVAVLHTEENYPHNGLSGLTWHPDGRLIFSLGENYFTDWTLSAGDGSSVTGTGEGGIFRCAPNGDGLERFARGFWNPFGVCVRESDGEMFVAENDPGSRPPCRLIHLVEDGDYGYQRLYGSAPYHPFVAWNGELRGTLPMLDAAGEAPCGILPLGSGVLVPSWSHNRIDYFPLRREGASFSSRRIEVVRGGTEFRPTCIAEGPDGAFYFTDWVYTSYELHRRGRLWRLDIDREAAWLGPTEPEPPNEASRLASALRAGKSGLELPALLELARGDDAFLSRAALRELSLRLDGWPSGWDDEDLANAVYARRLSHPSDETWIRQALAHDSSMVRFEALRWIADERLAAFAPEIDALLDEPDIDYGIFEACLAASNTLAGNPRAGIADIGMLLERVGNEDAPPRIRAFALRLLPPTHGKLTTPLLRELLEAGDETLTFEVTRTLAQRDTEAAGKLLAGIAADRALSSTIRAEAILGLARAPQEHAEQLARLARSDDPVVAAEAARATRVAPVAAILPPPGDLEAWAAFLAGAEGEPDPEAGRRLFFHPVLARCSSCHRHDGRGAVVGPDLSSVADGADPGWILHSILEPNAQVSPQFFPWSLELEDGSSFIGIALRKGGRSGKEFYRDITGKEQSFFKDRIVGRSELSTSLMPPGLLLMLSREEIRDLIAFLEEG